MRNRLAKAEPRNSSAVSIQFTEEMKGHVAFGESGFLKSEEIGRQTGTELRFRLTIVIDPIDGFVRDRRHQAVSHGWVHCESLGGKLPVESGVVKLLVEEGEPGQRRMLYRLQFSDAVGHPLTLSGFKTVRKQHGLPRDVWPDTTTLFTRIIRGHVPDPDDPTAEVAASGVLRISPLGFARQLLSFRTRGPTYRARYRGLFLFVKFFIGELLAIYARRSRRTVAS